MKATRILALTALAVLALTITGCDDDDDDFLDAADRRYRVTLENMTSSQPLSPGVLVTHAPSVHLWESGAMASEGIRLIAENGDPSTAMQMLPQVQGVDQVVGIEIPIHRIGGPGDTSATFEISAGSGITRLSMATMLICTNDGFTGVDSLELPTSLGEISVTSMAWDAGTEANDETSPSIVDACGAIGPVALADDGNTRNATSTPIAAHPGIGGGGDLTSADHGWQNPVLRIRVRRIN